MKVLFLGGIKHGHYLEVDCGLRYYRVPILKPMVMSLSTNMGPVSIDYQTYRIEQFFMANTDRVINCAVLDSLTNKEALVLFDELCSHFVPALQDVTYLNELR